MLKTIREHWESKDLAVSIETVLEEFNLGKHDNTEVSELLALFAHIIREDHRYLIFEEGYRTPKDITYNLLMHSYTDKIVALENWLRCAKIGDWLYDLNSDITIVRKK